MGRAIAGGAALRSVNYLFRIAPSQPAYRRIKSCDRFEFVSLPAVALSALGGPKR